MRFQTFSYRFAEQVLNSKLGTKKEVEGIIRSIRSTGYSRPELNKIFRMNFLERNWIEQPQVFEEITDIVAKIDYLKDRVGVEVAFTHSSFIGIDLLKFQALSYSNLDKIDVGVYITITREQRRKFEQEYNRKWQDSLTRARARANLRGCLLRIMPFRFTTLQFGRALSLLCKAPSTLQNI